MFEILTSRFTRSECGGWVGTTGRTLPTSAGTNRLGSTCAMYSGDLEDAKENNMIS